MLSVFDKVFKRSGRPSAANQIGQPSQTSLVNTSENDSKPDTEITASELASPQSKDLSRDIVFIDGAVENISHLLRELDPAADLYVLHLQSDGLEQISDYLSGREDLLAVHIFCNGGKDFLNLGSAKITNDSISRVQLASLMRIGAALAEKSDFLIYGCDLGTNDAGAELIANLSDIIGADIAVSPKAVGGDANPPKSVDEATISTSSVTDTEAAIPSIVGKTNGTNGTVVFDLNGNITYVADPGFYGADTFEYKVGTGDTTERVKVHINILADEETRNTESVSHFNVVSESLLTSVTSNHGLSLAEGKLTLGENGKSEFVYSKAASELSIVSINLQKINGEGSPSFKIAVAPSDFIPSVVVAEPIVVVEPQETPPLEAREAAVEAAPEPAPETVEQAPIPEVAEPEVAETEVTEPVSAEPEVVETEVVEENITEAATYMPLQFEDFTGGSLSFPFDPQLQEPGLTGNSVLGQLFVDSYVRPGTLFLDVNNSFDPREQGVVSHYLVKHADGSPLQDRVQIIRDGFFTVDQSMGGGDLDLLIEAELLDGHIVSRALRVNIETGSLEALAIDGAVDTSISVTQAKVSARDGSEIRSNATNNH